MDLTIGKEAAILSRLQIPQIMLGRARGCLSAILLVASFPKVALIDGCNVRDASTALWRGTP
jgi:hypothetical protein